ncbi:hypothetical protein GGR54DRAFT_645051 [Hypoxylon sp. NC1633]|nr:hypothetical protein GGR54DRAFT_645051 [Hypoxylon sp. NC1633]
MSVRSFAAFEKDDSEDEDEANILDILGRRASLGTSVAETVASPVTFRKIWAETANLMLQLGNPTRSESIRSTPKHGQTRLMIATKPSSPQSAKPCSPSSTPRSLLSRSTNSKETSSSSPSSVALHGLQSKAPVEQNELKPLAEEDIDPASFDLVPPYSSSVVQYSLGTSSEALFSTDHLKGIIEDPLRLRKFTSFLHAFRPNSLPILMYYLDAIKASRAISYANAITQTLNGIEGLELNEEATLDTLNESLMENANKAIQTLAQEDLPPCITHTWIQLVSMTLRKRVADTLPCHLRDLSEGLAEAFCLTDPSEHDHPIVFCSEEFCKMTLYGMGYALGRNCRFLQGHNPDLSSTRRIRKHMEEGKEHWETFLNYRRDGSSFMNLLMVAPLFDNRGVVRYHIGAQVDVSGLAKECAGLESLKRHVALDHDESDSDNGEGPAVRSVTEDEFRELVEMFSLQEMKMVREAGGTYSQLLITDGSNPRGRSSSSILGLSGGRQTAFEYYLLVCPYPNLGVLFASPSMRIPGMLQSSFLSRIGGSPSVREAIVQAFADGCGFTTKIRWVNRSDNSGKGRWIHCTPLLGANKAVGVWMVILIDEEGGIGAKRNRDAPPVNSMTGGQKPFDEDATSIFSFAKVTEEADKSRPPPVSKGL